MYTIDDAKQWAVENLEELDSDRLSSKDKTVQLFNRLMPALAKVLWDSGCWLAERLREHGATDEEVGSIQMAHGQRSLGGDCWIAAVDYANEYASTGDTEEKGGLALARTRHSELFGD